MKLDVDHPEIDSKVSSKNGRTEKIAEFVVGSDIYYKEVFGLIGAESRFVWTFNISAGLLGPIWFGMRGIWNWALAFLILETFAWVQIIRGFLGNLAFEAWVRVEQIEKTLAFREKQLTAAIEKGSDKVQIYQRNVESLLDSIGSIRLEAQKLEDSGVYVGLFGCFLLILAKFCQSVIANKLLEMRFSEWLSDSRIDRGMTTYHKIFSTFFTFLILTPTVTHYSFPSYVEVLAVFPTDYVIRKNWVGFVESFFTSLVYYGEDFFDLITFGIRFVLDGLEIIFVKTPWIVIGSFLILLTALSAGIGTAIYTAGFLFYIGLLGFWEKAMTTLALLGTAACLSIVIGIPLGMFCARRPSFYNFIRPVMDFMQTMPAFVFMIPVVAFFGVGKPAAVVTTMIFGGTPVVRLTVLGLRGVPEHIREAAVAFGASKWFLLTRVDLPLASPSIRAGVNQTIMLSLAMVVVASLIGAKGLGEDVLEALEYSRVGLGILSGFAILFCAMILDRIIQGKRKS